MPRARRPSEWLWALYIAHARSYRSGQAVSKGFREVCTIMELLGASMSESDAGTRQEERQNRST